IRATPIYVLWASRLPDFRAFDDAWGMTAVSLDLALKPHLGASWHGRGPAIVLNDGKMIADLEGHHDELEATLDLTFVHELTHIAASGVELSMPDSELEKNFAEIQLSSPLPEFTAERDTFVEHDERFVRAYLHVISRAYDAGVKVDPFIEFEQLRLSSAELYGQILRDEIRLLADQSVTRILNELEPPEEFVELYASDVSRCRANCS